MTEVLAKDLKAGMVIVDGDYEPVYVAYAEVDSFSQHTVYAVMDSLAVGLMHRTYSADDRLTQASADQAREYFQHRQSRSRRKRLVEGCDKLRTLFADPDTPLPPGPVRVRIEVTDEATRHALADGIRALGITRYPDADPEMVITLGWKP